MISFLGEIIINQIIYFFFFSFRHRSYAIWVNVIPDSVGCRLPYYTVTHSHCDLVYQKAVAKESLKSKSNYVSC